MYSPVPYPRCPGNLADMPNKRVAPFEASAATYRVLENKQERKIFQAEMGRVKVGGSAKFATNGHFGFLSVI